MRKFRNNKGAVLFLSIAMVFSVSSCDIFDLDVNTDPNNPSQASLNLLFANATFEASDIFAGALNDAAMGFMSLTASTDDFNMTNASWNGTWNDLYQIPLADLDRVIVAATEADNVPRQLGAAQILKAYYFSLMVDLWGDVPYFEAFQGDQGIKTPVFDSGSAIYNDLLTLIDNGIANLAEASTAAIGGDLIYGGNVSRWTKAGYSLKLRLLLQMSKVDASATAKIQALVDQNAATSGGIFISSAVDDFQFRFSKTVNPDNRHPMYRAGYAGGEAGYTYFGHKIMAEMLMNRDPRTPFYFKRQTSEVLNMDDPAQKQTAPCSQRADCVYNYFPLSNYVSNLVFAKPAADLTDKESAYLAGYFGRDRSDPSGIPNDNPLRTTVGAYPAAGLFDDVAEAGGGNKGSGDGIFPMITTWMVKFYLLEAQIALGVDAKKTNEALLREAIDEQITKVMAIGVAADPQASADVAGWPTAFSSWAVTYKTKTAFLDDVVAGYTAFAGNKLQYVLKQAWFANFGNGYEVYNAFRRTGFPGDLQTPLQIPRQFALRLPYAQSEVNLNPNVPAVVYDSPANAVFWDALKFQF